jgi:hypothetical protein
MPRFDGAPNTPGVSDNDYSGGIFWSKFCNIAVKGESLFAGDVLNRHISDACDTDGDSHRIHNTVIDAHME